MTLKIIEKNGHRREVEPDEALVLPIVNRTKLHVLLRDVEREEGERLKKHELLERVAEVALKLRKGP